MPGHRFSGSLLHFWLLSGSPWSWQTWKDLTGLSDGLFPNDDSKLPLGLTRNKVESIKAFISEYSNLSKEDDKIKFLQKRGSVPNAGRDAWLDISSKVWKKAKIHDHIVKCFRDVRIHPADLCSNNSTNPSNIKAEDYLPLAIDSIGLQLFGPDILDSSSSLVAQPYRSLVRQVAMQSWESLRYHLIRASTKLPELKEKALEAIKGQYLRSLAKNIYILTYQFQVVNLGYTKPKFEMAIKATSRYHAATLLNGTLEDQKDAEQLRLDIQDWFVNLGQTQNLIINDKAGPKASGMYTYIILKFYFNANV